MIYCFFLLKGTNWIFTISLLPASPMIFLNYIHQMTSLNMELASEFIFVAATLMRIKAKMLLPRYEAEEGSEHDPKAELIRKLIEYKKFKQICEELRPFEEERLKQERRGNIAYDLQQVDKVTIPGEELSEVTLYKLMMIYEKVTKRFATRTEEVTHTVVQYPYTIESQKKVINDLRCSSTGGLILNRSPAGRKIRCILYTTSWHCLRCCSRNLSKSK